MSNQKPETLFRYQDVRLLREALSNIHKKAPTQIKKKIESVLGQFADNVKEYCQCEEKVFIKHEKKFACLSCGRRHRSKDGDSVRLISD